MLLIQNKWYYFRFNVRFGFSRPGIYESVLYLRFCVHVNDDFIQNRNRLINLEWRKHIPTNILQLKIRLAMYYE